MKIEIENAELKKQGYPINTVISGWYQSATDDRVIYYKKGSGDVIRFDPRSVAFYKSHDLVGTRVFSLASGTKIIITTE